MDAKSGQGSSNNNRKSSRLSKSEIIKEGKSSSSISKKNLYKISNKSLDKFKESEEEEKYLVVSAIKQSILDATFLKIFENYLEKQTVYFVSHCSQLAWKALIKWNYQRKDSHGFRELAKDHLDIEPGTSKKDSWAGHSILCDSKEHHTITTIMKEKNRKSFEEECVISPHHVSNCSKEERCSSLEEERKTTVTKARKIMQQMKSTKLKKSEDFYPESVKERTTKSIPLRLDSYELPSPVILQPKLFPSSTVKVKYEVTPGTREVMSRKKANTKTIHLHRSDAGVNAEDNIPNLSNETQIIN